MSSNGDHVVNPDRVGSFSVGEQSFRIRKVSPRIWQEGVEKQIELEADEDKTVLETLDGMAEFVKISLYPEDHERWQELYSQDFDGLDRADLQAVWSLLWEAHTGRPTLSAEASSPGPGNSEASSKAAGSSQGAKRPR